MTRPNKEFGFRGSNRIAPYLFAGAACFLLVTGPALGAPATTNTNGAVASASQQNLPPSVRRELWLSLTNAIDQNKFERICQCMQFLGAPVDFAEAINICAPCMSAGGRIGAAALTDQERSCVKRRTSNGGGQGAQSAGDGKYDATVNPQCSAANPGPLAEAGGGEDDLKWLLIAEARTNQAAQDLYDAQRAAEQAHSRVSDRLAELDGDDNPAEGEDPELDRLQAAADAADRRVRRREGDLRWAVFVENTARQFYERAQARRHQDPSVDPTGQDLPGTGGEDPRCAGKRRGAAWGVPWSDICRGEDGHLVDFKECRRRMTDRIYAASGGRCWTEPGPDDATRTVCRDDTPSGGNAGNTPPCDSAQSGDQCLNEPDFRRRATPSGNASVGPVPNPIKPLLEQMCAKGRCPDPAPFNEPIGRASNGSAGASNMMPSAPTGQALRLKGLKLAPPVTKRLQQGLPGTGAKLDKTRLLRTPR